MSRQKSFLSPDSRHEWRGYQELMLLRRLYSFKVSFSLFPTKRHSDTDARCLVWMEELMEKEQFFGLIWISLIYVHQSFVHVSPRRDTLWDYFGVWANILVWWMFGCCGSFCIQMSLPKRGELLNGPTILRSDGLRFTRNV